MAHVENRASFLAARHCGHPLLSAYGMLVATEIALKDHSGGWRKKHDIPQMLDDLADPGLTALGATLRRSLATIPCTDINGGAATVPADKYPHMRYARHEYDLAGGVTEMDLEALILTTEDIIAQLRAKGVAI